MSLSELRHDNVDLMTSCDALIHDYLELKGIVNQDIKSVAIWSKVLLMSQAGMQVRMITITYTVSSNLFVYLRKYCVNLQWSITHRHNKNYS